MQFKHKVKSKYNPTFRTQKVAGMYDTSPGEYIENEWDVDFPIEDKEWQIGLIVGASGAGKTTLSKVIFGDDNYHEGFEWNRDRSLLDDFKKGLSVDDIVKALSHVGFNSSPAWSLPYAHLSNGQKFRTEMARLILEHDSDAPIVVDEFTSVVDRQVAKATSHAVQKYVRKGDKKFVAVSCHSDIKDWLCPDWILTVAPGQCTFEYTRGLLRRPEIKLNVQRVHYSAWELFKGHHYLDATVHRSSHCYVATWEGEPVAFCAAIKQPHAQSKNLWRSHRTVVLPDYQGIGVGGAINEAVAEIYFQQGMKFTGVASHPAMIAYRNKSPKWKLIRAPSMGVQRGENSKVTGQAIGRLTASHVYVGEPKDDS